MITAQRGMSQDTSCIQYALRDPVMLTQSLFLVPDMRMFCSGISVYTIAHTRQKQQAKSPMPPLSSIMAMAAIVAFTIRVRSYCQG